MCTCLQVVHPAIEVGRKKVVAAKKAACEMKALFAQPVVTVVTAFLMLSVAVIASYLPRQIQKNNEQCPGQGMAIAKMYTMCTFLQWPFLAYTYYT